MDRKQAGIIVALLALIVFAGVLSFKVNDNAMLNADATYEDGESYETLSSSTYFTEAKLEREQNYAQSFQNLQNLIDNENTPKEEKKEAAAEYRNLTTELEKSKKVELKLKGHGFEDVVCYINDDKVTVFIKKDKELSEEERKLITDVVMSTTKIKDVEITVKK